MVRKSLAGLLILVVGAWAEMVVAPMFSIRVAHLHPARDMAQAMAAHDHAMPAAHPCCHGFKGALGAIPTLEFAAAVLPCSDQHRCCFRQGPQSAPAPVRATADDSREIAAINFSSTAPTIQTAPAASVPVAFVLPPLDIFGVVLRI